MAVIDTIALILVIVGGINWGSIGVFDVNFVYMLFGTDSIISNAILILVGLASLWCITLLFKDKR